MVMDWKKLALSAIAFTVISQITYTLGAFADMPYYANPEYAAVWSKIMMPSQGAPPAEFFALSTSATLALGCVFSYGYSFVVKAFIKDKAFSAEKPWKTGVKYGIFVFALTAPGMLTLPLLVNIPFGLALSWVLQGLAAMLLSGAAAGMVYGRK